MRASPGIVTLLLGSALAALLCVVDVCHAAPASPQAGAAAKPVRFELRRIVEGRTNGDVEAAEADPVLASRVVSGAGGSALLADEPPVLLNPDILAARTLGYDPLENANDIHMVQVQLTEEGKRKLAALGGNFVASGYRIVLDGRLVDAGDVGLFPEDGRLWVRLDPARIPLDLIVRGIAPPGSPVYAWPAVSWRPRIPEPPKPLHQPLTDRARQWMDAPNAIFVAGLIVTAGAILVAFFFARRIRLWIWAGIALWVMALSWLLLDGKPAALLAGQQGRLYFACSGHRFGVLVLRVIGVGNEGETKGHALACAARNGHLPMVRMLVALGDEVDGIVVARENLRPEDLARMRLYGMAPQPGPPSTAMAVAIDGGQPDVVEVLLQLGASASRPSGHAFGPVHVAARRGCFRCLEILAAHKADFNDPVPALPAVLWLEGRHTGAGLDHLEWLEHFGAQLGKAGTDGRTLLHVAAKESGMQVLDFLLAKGLDPAAVDAKGMTPLMYAQRGYEEGPTPRRQGVILRLGALAPR